MTAATSSPTTSGVAQPGLRSPAGPAFARLFELHRRCGAKAIAHGQAGRPIDARWWWARSHGFHMASLAAQRLVLS